MEAAGKKRSRKTKLVCRQVVELDEELEKLINATQDLKSHETDEVYNTVALVDPDQKEVKTEDLFAQYQKSPDRNDDRPEFDADEPPEFDEKELEKDKEWQMDELHIKEDNPNESDAAELSVAKKLSKLKADDSDDVDKSFQFSVNIEVEEFNYDEELDNDDDDFCIETAKLGELSLHSDLLPNPYAFRDHDYEKPLDLLSRDDINQIIHEDVEVITTNSDAGQTDTNQNPIDTINKETILNNMENLKANKDSFKYLSPEFVLQTTKEALWKDIEDMKEHVGPVHKAIQLHMRNNFGKLIDVVEKNELDEKFIPAFDLWNTWYRINLEPIYCYKCYMCRKAWYHLNDLKVHLKNHKENYNIDAEINNLTLNIVAFVGDRPEEETLPISNKCAMCVKSSEDHEIYSCFGCSYIFQTCSRLRVHEGGCPAFKAVYKQKYGEDAVYIGCDLCKMFYFSKNEYEEHFTVKHLPRSDYIVPYRSNNKCKDCNNIVGCLLSHTCASMSFKISCVYCNEKFNNAKMLNIHKEANTCKMTCQFCGQLLEQRCQEAYHMMEHTNKYVHVYKCLYCVGELFLFKKHEGLGLHRKLMHADRQKTQFVQTIIPAKCFDIAKESIQSKIDEESLALEEQLKICTNISNIDNQPIIEPATYTSTLTEEDFEKVTVSIEPVKPKKSKSNATKTPKTKKTAPKTKKTALKTKKNKAQVQEIKWSTSTQKAEEKSSTSNGDENIASNYEILISNIFDQTNSSSGLTEGTIQVMSNDSIKEEPMDYDESMMSGSIYNMSFFTDEASQMENNYVDVEPEVILHSFLKRSYKCTKCGYLGLRKEYKEHIAGKCKPKPAIDPLIPGSLKINSIFRCTKCSDENTSLKGYIKHLKDHSLAKNECPECRVVLKCYTTLANHILVHIKDLFQRIVALSDEQIRQNYYYRCKICKLQLVDKDFFEHWESHLQLTVIKQEYDPIGEYSGLPLSMALPDTWPINQDYHEIIPKIEYDIPDMPHDLHNWDEARMNSNPMLLRISKEDMKLLIEFLIAKKSKKHGKRHTCMLCMKPFNRLYDLKRHLIEHLLIQAFAKKPWTNGLQCQICGVLHERPDLYKHHMREHARLPVYTCQLCNRSFSDSSNFTKHKKVHNYKVLICDHCGGKFHTKASIVKHMESHLEQNLLRCKECKSEFALQSHLTKHYRKVHLKTKQLPRCQICQKKFKNMRTKWDHLWHVHKERSMEIDCTVCGHKFRKFLDLKNHMKTNHPGVRILCPKLT